MEEFKSYNQEKMEKEIVNENFSSWNKALLTKDPEKVAAIYDEDATFLPTLSSDFKKGQEGVKAYFEHFLEKNPVSKIVEDEVQFLGTDCYLHSGFYVFELGPETDRQLVEARFSFVWKKNKAGEWKIIHHHSSIKPRE